MSRAAGGEALPEVTADAAQSAAGHRKELLRQMLLIRRFEEKCVQLYSAAEIRGFVHLYIGEEAVAVGVNQALTPDDSIVSTYREHGHALVRSLPLDSVMAEMYGKTTGCSRGRGGSMHLFDVTRRSYGGNLLAGAPRNGFADLPLQGPGPGERASREGSPLDGAIRPERQA